MAKGPTKSGAFIVLVSIGVIISCITFTLQHHEIYDKLNGMEYSHTVINLINPTENLIVDDLLKNEPISTPATWQQLNEQQFCRIEQSKSYQTQVTYFKFLHKIQFPLNCTAATQRFLIYDIYLEKGSGLGASLFGNILRYFTTALLLNRTFLLHGVFDWSEIGDYCRNKNGMECYFLPLSNCDPLDVLSNINKSDHNLYYEGNGYGPVEGGLLAKCDNSYCVTQKVIYVNQRSAARPVMRRAISKFSNWRFKMTAAEYSGVTLSFLLRPQPAIRQIVFDKIRKSINKSVSKSNIRFIDPAKTVSLPIRASDKCSNINSITGKQYSHAAEIDCFTPVEYVYLMNSIKYLSNDQIRNVILTSEDILFVDKVTQTMKNDSYSNVTDWNIVLNTEDYSVGEGTTTFQKTLRHFGKHFSKNDTHTSLETDHIVSAISSLVLQIHLDTQYFIVLASSTWTKLMWSWLSKLNCNINDPQKHVMKSNKCISLIVPGYQTRGLTFKYIKFSQDLWKKIHKENLNPNRFYDKFNIKIGNDGWDNYCTV